jgi:hypothetical protein
MKSPINIDFKNDSPEFIHSMKHLDPSCDEISGSKHTNEGESVLFIKLGGPVVLWKGYHRGLDISFNLIYDG